MTANGDRLSQLEERLAWLQRHVSEQDRAMLAMAGEIDRLKQQVAALRARPAPDDGPHHEVDELPPPHY